MPGNERETIPLSAIQAPKPGGEVRRYVLWPYDRAESRGRLKGVSLRLEDGRMVVLGYRWVAGCTLHPNCLLSLGRLGMRIFKS